MACSRSHLFRGNSVSPLEHPPKAPARIATPKELPDRAQWKFIFHGIFEPTAALVFRPKYVRVFPMTKRTTAHDIAKHLVRLASNVFSDPVL